MGRKKGRYVWGSEAAIPVQEETEDMNKHGFRKKKRQWQMEFRDGRDGKKEPGEKAHH